MRRIHYLFLALLSVGLAGCAGMSGQNGSIRSAMADPMHNASSKGYSYFPMTRPATGQNVFVFDPNYHAWAAYNGAGERVNVGAASGGKAFCPDLHRACRTTVGRYRVFKKGGPDCISHRFPLETHGGAHMPYCMHFLNGYSIHGAYDVPDYNISHGCIRVTIGAARWLSQNFIHIGTPVIILPYHRD